MQPSLYQHGELPTLLNNFKLTKLEFVRIIRAVKNVTDSGFDGREISAVVCRREGFPEWKVDAALHLRAELAERQLAAITVGLRNALDTPRDIEREFWSQF